jgi:hypothetical protein
MGRELWRYEQTTGPSTPPLAMKLREASLRMTILIENQLRPTYIYMLILPSQPAMDRSAG